jgi:hypothetical protein
MKKRLLHLILLLILSWPVFSQNLKINEFVSSNSTGMKDEDEEYQDWIEIYNAGPAAVNLLNFGLSDSRTQPLKWTFPDLSLPANAFLLVFASDKNRLSGQYLHSNFKIGAEGEPLLLSRADGSLIDSLPASVVIPANVSYGRKPDGSATFVMFQAPTPNASNNAAAEYGEPLEIPAFSKPGGFYTSALQLSITAPAGATIRYTLDGSEPTETSPVYTGPFTIASRAGAPNVLANIRTTTPAFYFRAPTTELFKGTPVRAKAFKAGSAPSGVVTSTYFVDANMASRYTMPVFSVTTSAANLFDPQIGIYVPGNGYNGVDWKTANSYQEGDAWERPANVEMFERNGTPVFNQNAGIRINGNFSTQYAQKALRLYARENYGSPNNFNYQLFPDKNISRFKSFLLRNAGSDYGEANMRDFTLQSLVRHLGLTLAYRPALVFINGEYWGVHDMRERFDDNYFENNLGINKDSLDYLESNKVVKEGDNVHYVAMLDYAKDHDVAQSTHYDEIKTRMDVDNFASYWVAEMIVNNRDWVNSNVQYFRKKTSAYVPNAPYGHDGRWRWIFQDLDISFRGPEDNNFAITVDANSWTTDLVRSLLANPQFKNNFVNQFADQLNSCFKTEHVLRRIDSVATLLEPEMAGHTARWGLPGSINSWKTNVELLRDFARKRPGYMRSHVIQRFNLNGTRQIELNVNDATMGKVKINTLTIDENTPGLALNAPVYPWTGTYFESVPIPITAVPKPGYRFASWSNPALPKTPTINVTIDRYTAFTALFELDAASLRPTPFDLATGNFSFTSWPAGSAAGTYPPHMLFQRGNATAATDPLLADPMGNDYTGGYNATSQTRINGLGNDGFAFINTGTNPNLGAAVLALKTVGRSNIVLNWTAGTVTTTPRDFRIRLQYKVGGAAWMDVTGPIEYTRNATAGHSQTFSNINLSTLTGNAINNQPIVYLRWKYYNADASTTGGARSQLRVDEITVSSSSSGAVPVVNAGIDQTITLPANTLTLNGTATDADGTIASYLWTKVAGPAATLSGASTASLSLSSLVEGVYQFQLKATDNSGNSATDQVTVKVLPANLPPVVSLVSPANNAQIAAGDNLVLTVQASDVDGSIAKVQIFRGAEMMKELSSGPYTHTLSNLTAGSYAFSAKAFDDKGASATSSVVNVSVSAAVNCSATGTILREVWLAAEGETVASIPLNTPASFFSYPTILETPSNETDRYGSRLRGYLCAPTTGSYIFWIASDNHGELWLSTDANPANKVKIASVTGNTQPQEWTKYPSQQSVGISLQAGKKYYIEVLHKEASGGDNLAVGWTLPNGTQERPIPGARLSPFILPANQLPTVSITSPAGGASFVQGANITMSADAADSDGAISRVEFYRGEVLINRDLSAPFSTVFTNSQPGTYALTAKAYDNLGSVTTSSPVSITVVANAVPSISITSPTNGAKFSVGATITMTATAADADGTVAQVEFFNGSTSIGADNAAPYEASIPNAPLGSYLLTAIATDNHGATSTSAVVTVMVENVITSTKPPVVAMNTSLIVRPNPFSDEVNIQFSSSESGPAEVALYDLRGVRIRPLFQGELVAGEVKTVLMKAESLTNGLYLIRMKSPGSSQYYKVVLSR